jgi:hypothetical protein
MDSGEVRIPMNNVWKNRRRRPITFNSGIPFKFQDPTQMTPKTLKEQTFTNEAEDSHISPGGDNKA